MKSEFIEKAVLSTVNQLGIQFDSHDFIRKFVFDYPVLYGQMLIEHKNVSTANAEISNYLRNHSKQLGIYQNEKQYSVDMFNNNTECASWVKTIKTAKN